MASYLDRLITLDEEGTENLDTSFEAEQTQDITEVIDVDTNNDEINAEAVAIEEDLEAMQDGTEAVGELAEQESVNDELLESPGDISPEVAKATNDAFKVTLAGLAIDVRDTVYGNITYDSNRNEPIEVVRITNDGVKDFLSKIKEHIIAFFRTIKAKIQKLIAKLFIMFSDVSKKGEALHKQLKNKLDRLKNKKVGKNNVDIDVSRAETKSKIASYMPIGLYLNNGNVEVTVKMLESIFTTSNSLPYGVLHISPMLDELNKIMNTTEGKGGSGSWDASKTIKKLDGATKNVVGIANVAKMWDEVEKANYETTEPILVSGMFSKVGDGVCFRIHEDADVLIPAIVWVKCKLKQSNIDDMNISGVCTDSIKSMINCAIKIGKNSKGTCEAAYKYLGDAEKDIINTCDKMAKDGDVTNGTFVKYSSVTRSLVASIVFKSVMEQAKAGRRVLALANYLYNQLDEDYKDAKKEDKRK